MSEDKRDRSVNRAQGRSDAYERELATDLKDQTPDRPKGMALHTRVLIGLVVGVVAGVVTYALFSIPDPNVAGGRVTNPAVERFIYHVTEPIGQLFLRLLLMTVIPLVFSSLVVGVAGIGDIRRLGRVGLKSFAYTFVISAISVVIGLTVANTIRPGERISPDTARGLEARYGADASKRVADATKTGTTDSALMQVVKTIVPSNPIASFAGVKQGAATQSDTPDMLHLMFFAVLLGVAATLIPVEVSAPLLRGLQALFEISAKLIDFIMKIAPFAVACLLFNNTARFGLDLLGALGWFMLTVLLGLALHMFGVYSLSVYFLSRINPLEFFRRIKTVMLTAFSTSSSNATLPTALRVSEENLGVPREINSFVLTVGATANQNGTA
ncbi:MAG: dicarboxylate/amino acid:cation symporter, partial [Pyrinomonadaceae bacterium]